MEIQTLQVEMRLTPTTILKMIHPFWVLVLEV
jgi:hypothetical protein